MNEFVAIGKLVTLRNMARMDSEKIVKWRNNPRVRGNFIYRENFTLDGQFEWFDTMIATGKVVQLIIGEKKNGSRPVGCVYFRDIDEKKREAEYGIFIGEDDAEGKGYGSETAQLAVKYAKEKLNLDRLILRVFSRNLQAIKSYEKAGFEKYADKPSVECSDGTVGDMIMMEKIL